MRTRRLEKGFFLTEALVVILILSVAFVSFAGVIGQALRVSRRSIKAADAVFEREFVQFQIENGFRADLR